MPSTQVFTQPMFPFLVVSQYGREINTVKGYKQ